MKITTALLTVLLTVSLSVRAEDPVMLLAPAGVFDGEEMHTGWVIAIAGDSIVYAGSVDALPRLRIDTNIELPGQTLLPGLIEGHSHILLHPYNETSWDDQVLRESMAERVARAVNHLRASLMAGITTMRDLGTEGAGYADLGLRDSIDKGIIPGPRLLVSGRALVATGSYGPKGFHEGVHVPLGAQTADGYDGLVRATREQIGRGIDWVKVYADYRWGPDGAAAPTFTQTELETIVAVTSGATAGTSPRRCCARR